MSYVFQGCDRRDTALSDMTTFKYISISQAEEIPNKIGAEIITATDYVVKVQYKIFADFRGRQ